MKPGLDLPANAGDGLVGRSGEASEQRDPLRVILTPELLPIGGLICPALHALLRGLNIHSWVTLADDELNICAISEPLRAWMGRVDAGAPLLDRYHLSDADRSAIREDLRDKGCWSGSLRWTESWGQAAWTRATLLAFPGSDEGEQRHVLIETDITAERLLEQRSAARAELAEASTTAAADVLASTAHDMRTAIACIAALSELQLMSADNAKKRRQLELIHSSALNLAGAAGRMAELLAPPPQDRSAPEAFSPGAMVDDAVRTVRRAVDRQSSTIVVEVAASVPPVLFGRPRLLRRAVIYLLSTALRLSDDADATVQVHAQPAAAGQQLLQVRVGMPVDSGAGLSRFPWTACEGLLHPLGAQARLEEDGRNTVLHAEFILDPPDLNAA